MGPISQDERLRQALQGSTCWQEATSWPWCRSRPCGKSQTAVSALLADGMRCLRTPTLVDRCHYMLIVVAAADSHVTLDYPVTSRDNVVATAANSCDCRKQLLCIWRG